MKLRLSIILLAAALAASPAAGQTIKSLGYNTTNGNIVAATNVTFTNSVGFATNARAATRTNLGGTSVGNSVFTATNAAAAATAVGLGTTNGVEFQTVKINLSTGIGNSLIVTNSLSSATSLFDDITVNELDAETAAFGNTVIVSSNGISFNTNTAAALTRTNLGLGATNNVTFSNITASGTLAVTGNVTMSGVNNTATAQTADSASSLMTRDLVGQELANPRNKIQTTYWFGLEGLGLWQAVNGANASVVGNRGPRWGGSLAVFGNTTNNRSAVTAAGFGLRLGAVNVTGLGTWRPADGGAFTARSHVVNYYSATGGANLAFGFTFAAGNNTNFWAAPNSFGLFWVQQPTNSWAASTAFAQHDRIAVSNVVWTVATAGTTDTNEPVWTDLINSTVTNGTAVFRNLGPHTSNNWVLAIGHTNASGVVMTNTGKTKWVRASGGGGHEVLLTLRYDTNTTAPFTVYGSVADGAGQGSEVALNLSTNNTFASPQYWMRWDGTNTGVGNEAAGIRYFSIDAELPPLD